MERSHQHIPGGIKPSEQLREAIGLNPEKVGELLKDGGEALLVRDGDRPRLPSVQGEKSVRYYVRFRLYPNHPWQMLAKSYTHVDDALVMVGLQRKHLKKNSSIKIIKHEIYETEIKIY